MNTSNQVSSTKIIDRANFSTKKQIDSQEKLN